MINKTLLLKKTALLIPILIFAPLIWAHHMAPEDMIDFIEDQLLAVDSPHLESSEDDPSLLDTAPYTMDDVDYVALGSGLEETDAVEVVEEIVPVLDDVDELCDDSFSIDMDGDNTYTVTIYLDFCDL